MKRATTKKYLEERIAELSRNLSDCHFKAKNSEDNIEVVLNNGLIIAITLAIAELEVVLKHI